MIAVSAVVALCLAVGASRATAAGSASPTGSASPASITPPSPETGKTVLHIGWTTDVDSMNPFVGYAAQAYRVYSLNYDMLLTYNASNLQPGPGLATSWSHSADGKTWIFKLRQGVKWQDGEAFTSRDVVFTFNYIIKNDLSAYTSYTKGITSVVALDDYTVKFTCQVPKATMLQMWVPILPQHIWSHISPQDAGNKFQNLPPIIGTGPFQVTAWKRGSYVIMRANPDYWGGRPKVDQIYFETYTNGDTMASDLRAGLLQYATVTPALYQSFKSAPGVTAALSTHLAYDQLAFNCYTGPSDGNPVLLDPAFRSALAWAIDTKTIASIAYNGAAVPATGILTSDFYPKSSDYHWQPTPDQAYRYDPAKADALLTAAGYPLKNGVRVDKQGKPIKLRLWAFTDYPELPVDGKLITGYLRKLGLQITFQTMDPSAGMDGIYATKNGKLRPNYDMFVWGWGGDIDPSFMLAGLTTAQIGDWSDSGWSNAQYDRLYSQQNAALDVAKRVDLVHQMQAIIYKQAPYIALVYPQGREVYDTQHWT
ncbi:MAG: ABC transporter substrate-binding protein, partial [Actinomycetes bacterium]